MKQFIQKLLGIKPNDWVPVWSECGEWCMYSEFRENAGISTCSFTIQWSESRKRYRMKLTGLTPSEHPNYKLACAKMAELINNDKTGNQ